MTTEATESETEPQKLHNCRHVWQGDYPDERAIHTPRGALACAHDYVLGGLELIEDGNPDEAADWALTAKLFLTGFLERCDGESLAIAGGVLPIHDQERDGFSEIADVLGEARQQGPDGLTRCFQEAHRRLHDVFDTAGDVRLSGVKMPADSGPSSRSPTTETSDDENSTDDLEVRCPTYITHERIERDNWRAETPFEHIENAHDQVRGALEAVQGGSSGEAVNLLLVGAAHIGRAAAELDEETRSVPGVKDHIFKSIAKLTTLDPAYREPSPAVELSDALIRPREELTLLELAVMEAPNRGEEFADMLKWRLHDTRRKLKEAQERATERLQARRGKMNGGGEA